MKLLLIIIEGQLYLATIVAIFAAEVGFLMWGLWSRRPIIGLIAIFVTVPLIRTTVSAIRAIRGPAPSCQPGLRSTSSRPSTGASSMSTPWGSTQRPDQAEARPGPTTEPMRCGGRAVAQGSQSTP